MRKLYHKTHRKASVFKRFTPLYCAQSGHSFVGFWLLRFQSLHEPAVLLWSQYLHLIFCARPLEAACFQPLIQKQKSVPLPVQRLDTIPASAAKQEQRCLKRIHLKLVLHHTSQSVYPTPEVRVAAGDVDRTMAIEVVQHERIVSTRAFSNSGCTPA